MSLTNSASNFIFQKFIFFVKFIQLPLIWFGSRKANESMGMMLEDISFNYFFFKTSLHPKQAN